MGDGEVDELREQLDDALSMLEQEEMLRKRFESQVATLEHDLRAAVRHRDLFKELAAEDAKSRKQFEDLYYHVLDENRRLERAVRAAEVKVALQQTTLDQVQQMLQAETHQRLQAEASQHVVLQRLSIEHNALHESLLSGAGAGAGADGAEKPMSPGVRSPGQASSSMSPSQLRESMRDVFAEQVALVESTVAENERMVTEASARNQRLAALLAQLSERSQEMQKAYDVEQATRKKLMEDIAAAEARLSELNEHIDELQAEKAVHEEALEDLHLQVADAESEVRARQQVTQAVRSARENLGARLDTARAALEEFDAQSLVSTAEPTPSPSATLVGDSAARGAQQQPAPPGDSSVAVRSGASSVQADAGAANVLAVQAAASPTKPPALDAPPDASPATQQQQQQQQQHVRKEELDAVVAALSAKGDMLAESQRVCARLMADLLMMTTKSERASRHVERLASELADANARISSLSTELDNVNAALKAQAAEAARALESEKRYAVERNLRLSLEASLRKMFAAVGRSDTDVGVDDDGGVLVDVQGWYEDFNNVLRRAREDGAETEHRRRMERERRVRAEQEEAFRHKLADKIRMLDMRRRDLVTVRTGLSGDDDGDDGDDDVEATEDDMASEGGSAAALGGSAALAGAARERVSMRGSVPLPPNASAVDSDTDSS